MRFQALKLKLGHCLQEHCPLVVPPDPLDVGSGADQENQGDWMDVDGKEGGENDEGSEDDWLAGADSDDEGEYAKEAAAIEEVAFVAIDRPDGTYWGRASVAPDTIEE
ncbi:hypothetical protein C8R45DRAFT_933125 [Mycena sanguinolenta]|nr:hypothetical protein C8R45DRAFT_933125 [Mycena sanguinolenta]